MGGTERAVTAADLTVEHKALLLEGVDSWRSNAIPELGIRSLVLTDGPHGVRKVREAGGGFAIGQNEPSIAYPPAVTVASGWNPDSAERMGRAIAREARALGVDVVLGPGVNIKRSPLCGRNFEYFSEDPLVSGVLGSALARGLQAEGVGASVKHFAANSNENYRFVGDSVVDERALREIYLRAFERVVVEAKPETVMCSYNRVNGTFASENRELLTGILREEWGFEGVVLTDWGATNDRVAGLLAGTDLDMPGEVPHNRQAIVEAVADGSLPVPVLDAAVDRMLRLVACHPDTPATPIDAARHAALSEEIAREGAVLLKNDGRLPIDPEAPGLLVVGAMFEAMRFQGAGSSLITPTEVVSPRTAFDRRGIGYEYRPGFDPLDGTTDAERVADAVAAARAAEIVLFFGGLTDFEESEGFDREHLRLSDGQRTLLAALVETGTPVVLVLFAGSPVEIPELGRLAAVLSLGLPGMRGGEAAADLLTGAANPSGKLAESWPARIDDSSAFADYNRGITARYAESIYVGYRYYDAAGTDLAFPFGFGLSYTRFEYAALGLAVDDGVVTARVTIRNIGDRAGAEVVQLYVGANESAVFKPLKELRAFARVDVPSGASREVTLRFALADLSYWNVERHGWVLEEGDYQLLVGASSADIRLTATLRVEGETSRSPYSPAVDRAYATPPRGIPSEFADLVGRAVPPDSTRHRLTLNTRLADARATLLGRLVGGAIIAALGRRYRAALALPPSLDRDAQVKNSYAIWRMMPSMSLRSLAMSSAGSFPVELARALDLLATGHPFRALRALIASRSRRP